MNRFGFALVAGFAATLFAAAPATADTPATAPAPAPVVVAPTTTAEVVPATPARRGLLTRLRERRGTTTAAPTAVPYTTSSGTIVTTPAPAVAPTPAAPVPTPMPMPTVKPISGTTTDGTSVTTAAFTTPAEPTTTTPVRRGLFSRLRSK